MAECITSLKKNTKQTFDILKKRNGWTADFFLCRLLDYWETTNLKNSPMENSINNKSEVKQNE